MGAVHMNPDEVLNVFRETGALLEGHFVYTSGRHGRQFLQAARVLQYPNHTERVCGGLAEPFQNEDIELVVGPATGGIILAYETARLLQCRAAFTEKDDGGGMSMKRGFSLEPGTRTLVVEDIVTTGGSVMKTVRHLENRGAVIAGIAIIVDRSGGGAELSNPYHALLQLRMESWPPEQCELCKRGIPEVEPDDIIV